MNIYVDPISHDGGTAIGYAKKFAYEYILIGAGIFFYAYWNVYLFPLIIVSIIANFFFGNLIRNIIE